MVIQNVQIFTLPPEKDSPKKPLEIQGQTGRSNGDIISPNLRFSHCGEIINICALVEGLNTGTKITYIVSVVHFSLLMFLSVQVVLKEVSG